MGKLEIEINERKKKDYWKISPWVTSYCKRQNKKQKKSHLVTDTGGEFMPPSYALG